MSEDARGHASIKASAPPARTGASEYHPTDPAVRSFIASLSYLEPNEVSQVIEAYRFSEKAHAGQKRISGEPYITHPLAVAKTLVEWHMDLQAIVAGLLHDVMEDTAVTKNEIAARFGKPVAELVDGLSKLEKIESQTYQQAQAENFRKMLMAMMRDLRVVLIKLADRLHNMQTMSFLRPDKRRRIAKETLEIYAPIAIRIGLNHVGRQLQDLSFQHIYPRRFQVLTKALKAVRGNRRELLAKILNGIRNKLREAKIEAGVFGREKSLYSIYHKMVEKHLSFSQVLDIYGFRIIVNDTPTCYLALGALHSLYKPVPGKFKDYIAIPKENGYQSLHTTLIGPYGTPIEIQIRTQSMHHVAEDGIASHWLYKDSEESGAELQIKTHKWLQSLFELQTSSGDSSEFLEHVKEDLFPDEVYVFTPKGKILSLPRQATVIDFAYAVHTDIGHHCVAAMVGHELIPLSAELSNGDQVEIITAPNATPNPAWLGYVKTSRARSKIRQFLRTQQQESASLLGKNLLGQALRAHGISQDKIPTAAWDDLVNKAGKKSKNDVYADIGQGNTPATVYAQRLANHEQVYADGERTPASLAIRGNEGAAIQLAPCCCPIPGDPIIGLPHKHSGLIVHSHTCPEIRGVQGNEANDWIQMSWAPEPGILFDTRIKVTIRHLNGMLGRIATAISQAGASIEQVNMDNQYHGLTSDLHFLIQVANRQHLARLIRQLRRIPEVIRIAREQQE